jgi:hypothetical protein
MAVRIEKSGPVWTVIHSRPDARNAMDPASADALVAAFHSFDADRRRSTMGRALETEWQTSIGIVTKEGISGAGRFSVGRGDTETMQISTKPRYAVR